MCTLYLQVYYANKCTNSVCRFYYANIGTPTWATYFMFLSDKQNMTGSGNNHNKNAIVLFLFSLLTNYKRTVLWSEKKLISTFPLQNADLRSLRMYGEPETKPIDRFYSKSVSRYLMTISTTLFLNFLITQKRRQLYPKNSTTKTGL